MLSIHNYQNKSDKDLLLVKDFFNRTAVKLVSKIRSSFRNNRKIQKLQYVKKSRKKLKLSSAFKTSSIVIPSEIKDLFHELSNTKYDDNINRTFHIHIKKNIAALLRIKYRMSYKQSDPLYL